MIVSPHLMSWLPSAQTPTSRLTGRVNVLATGDHFFTWATSALISSCAMPSHSMSTLTRTSVKPTGLSDVVAGAPDRGDVEVAFELELELVDDPAAMHGIGVQTDREARAQRGERGFRRIGRGVVAQKGPAARRRCRAANCGCSWRGGIFPPRPSCTSRS